MKKPNLFILGAPKCGTTSLADWLSNHPQIYFSKIKEPHYYNKDLNHNSVIDYSHYLSIFKKADDRHIRIGEASVWYLYSKVAVKNILEDIQDPNLKFIVMLRNPTKMAQSLHEQQVFNMNEPEKDFEKAWYLQPEREKNKKLGLTTRDSKLLLYGDICKLGLQVQRLLDKVQRNQVKFVLLDDIKDNPLDTYLDILSFLELDYDQKTDFTALNSSKIRKSSFIAISVKVLGKLKHRLKIKKGFGILNFTDSLNKKDEKRIPMNPEFEKKLNEFFREDIILLSQLIDRDLDNWLNE